MRIIFFCSLYLKFIEAIIPFYLHYCKNNELGNLLGIKNMKKSWSASNAEQKRLYIFPVYNQIADKKYLSHFGPWLLSRTIDQTNQIGNALLRNNWFCSILIFVRFCSNKNIYVNKVCEAMNTSETFFGYIYFNNPCKLT